MANEHCYNCLNTKHCTNYGKDVCAYDGDAPEDFEAREIALCANMRTTALRAAKAKNARSADTTKGLVKDNEN